MDAALTVTDLAIRQRAANDLPLALPLASGFLLFTAQAVMTFVCWLTFGETALAFFAVMGCFIVGSGCGAFLSERLGKYLYAYELASAVAFGALMYVNLNGLDQQAVKYACIFSILIVAFAGGVLLPAYMQRSKIKPIKVYAAYHLGGVAAIAAFICAFLAGVDVRSAVLIVVIGQVILSRCLYSIAVPSAPTGLGASVTGRPLWTQQMVLAGFLSWFGLYFISRDLAALYMPLMVWPWFQLLGVLVALMVAGFVRPSVGKYAWRYLVPFAPILAYCISHVLVDPAVGSGFLGFSIVAAFVVVVCSALVVFPSAVCFGLYHSESPCQGRIVGSCVLGNLLGLIAAALVYERAWNDAVAYVGLTALWFWVVVYQQRNPWRYVAAGSCLIVAVGMTFTRFVPTTEQLLEARASNFLDAPVSAQWIPTSQGVNAYMGADDGRQLYMVSGMPSHVISHASGEVAATLLAGFLRENYQRALVIGFGSGLSANAAALFAQQVEVVDTNSQIFASPYKLIDSAVQMHEADGFDRVGSCQAGELDLIISTSTPPSMVGARKLFTQQFVERAGHCLGNGGVLLAYSDVHIQSDASRCAFLGSLVSVFPYVYSTSTPYRLFAASHAPIEVASAPRVPAEKLHSLMNEFPGALFGSLKSAEGLARVNMAPCGQGGTVANSVYAMSGFWSDWKAWFPTIKEKSQ